ncbi:MAG: AmmeMemoRadiSam system radical SAM enzyme [Syntrophobacteraceae bacterium]
MKEAMLYKRLDNDRVHCFLCSQHCRIEPGETGKCGVRENRGGTLWSLVYGRLIAQHIDPIEKKPLYHYYPGTTSYSIATAGCNFRCLFCQNSDISQSPRETGAIFGHKVSAETVARDAAEAGCATIAYTYTEPTIFLEYALDVAVRAKELGLANVFVSNGYMTREALDAAAPILGAANVDLKAFSDKYYQEQCGARLKPVLATLEAMKEKGIWLEVTTLIVPGLNDGEDELRDLARFLAALGPEIPWHVSRFHPTYLLTDRGPTPVEKLRRAREIGLEAGLRYVYTGNAPGDSGENTFCHSCGDLLIKRVGYSTRFQGLEKGVCTGCGTPLAGVGIK